MPATWPSQLVLAGSPPVWPVLVVLVGVGEGAVAGAVRSLSVHWAGAAVSSRLRRSADCGCSERAFSALFAAASASPSSRCS